jgi:hypothetical protein
MNLSVFFTDKFKKDHNVKFFFTIVDSNITIENEGEKLDLNLNQISNARIIKRRNMIPNILILISAFLANFLLSSPQYSENRFKDFFLILIVLASFSIKHYSYRLLINKSNYCFNEFRISKQNLSCAQSFVSIFKTNTTTQYRNVKQDSDYLSECLA